MSQQTPTKPVLFRHTLTHVVLGVFSIVLSVLATTVLTAPQQASAATHSTINFQARLEGPSGNVANDGLYNIKFRLYAASGGGSPLWTEEYYDANGVTAGQDNRVTVTNGYVSVALGSQTAFGAQNWDQQLWLTMDVGGTTQTATPTYDGEMSPRLALAGVPYAFRAGAIATFGGTYTSTLSINAPTGGNQTFQLLDQGAGGTYTVLTNTNGVQLQASTPGSAQTGNFNITGTGIAGTAIKTPSIDVASAGALTVGNGTATSIGIGNTSSNIVTTISGRTIIKPTSGNDSATAFQLQNAVGSNLLNVSTLDDNSIVNPGAEVAFGSEWAAYGSNTTVTRYTSTAWSGDASVKVTVTPSTGTVGAKNNIITPLSTSVAHTLSFYAKLKSGDPAFTDITAAYLRDGSTTDASCGNYSGQTVTANGWSKISCTFTTSGTPGNSSAAIVIYQSASAAREWYLDGVQLENNPPNGNAFAYGVGQIRLDAPITSALLLQNAENSTTAFQIQNATGERLFTADTHNTKIIFQSAPTDSTTFFQIQDANGGTPVFNVDTDNERVGIGTATPRSDLDLGRQGAQLVIGQDNGGGAGGSIGFGGTPSEDGILFYGNDFSFITDQTNGFKFYADAGSDQTTPEFTLDNSGSAGFRTWQNTTNSFLLQNADGQENLRIDDTGNLNYIVNSSFEPSPLTNWTYTGTAGGSVSRQTTYKMYGYAALQVNTNGGAADGVLQTLASTLAPSTTYVISWEAYGGGFNGVTADFSYDGVNWSGCTGQNSFVASTTRWTREYCTFTTGSSGTAPTASNAIRIKQGVAGTYSFYVDGVRLDQNFFNGHFGYYTAVINQHATVWEGPLMIRSQNPTNHALQVKAFNGYTVFNVDALTGGVGIGTDLPEAELDVRGAVVIQGAATTVYQTPVTSTNIDVKLDLGTNDITGAFDAIIGGGLTATSHVDARGIVMVDARTSSHQPTIGVLSHDETEIGGFTWDGSVTDFEVKTSSATIALGNVGGKALMITNSGSDQRFEIGYSSSKNGQLQIENATNGNSVTLQAPTVSASYIMNLPTAIGSTGDCVKAGTVAGSTVPLVFGSCATGGNLQGTYDADANGSDAVIQLSSTDGSIILQNPVSTGITTGFMLKLDGDDTGGAGGLNIESAGSGDLLLITDTTATARDVLKIANGGATTFRNQTDSSAAFRVQDAAGGTWLNVDTIEGTLSAGAVSITHILSSASYSMFETTTPGGSPNNDSGSLNIGVKFRSDQAGDITGIRYYNPSGNNSAGTDVGKLWSCTDATCNLASGGTQLATVTFTADTSVGWKQATFSSPVAITADTYYIATYYSVDAMYYSNNSYFATGLDNVPLHAPADSFSPNGVYIYNGGAVFPNSNFQEANYWVDVMFEPDAGTDTINSANQLSVFSGTKLILGTNSQVTNIHGSTINMQGNIVASNDLAVNGGDITSSAGLAIANTSGTLRLQGGGDIIELENDDNATYRIQAEFTDDVVGVGGAAFQTNVTNGNTTLSVVPNGSGTASSILLNGNATGTGRWGAVTADSSAVYVDAGVVGSNASDLIFRTETPQGGALADRLTIGTYGGLTVAGTAALPPWTTNSNNFTAARYNHASVTAGGYVYVIGGTDGSNEHDDVYYAKVNSNGSIGTWAATSLLPADRMELTAVAANGYIYAIGGKDSPNAEDEVYYAKQNTDGTLGSWNTTTALPASRNEHTSVIANGYVYVIGGENGGVAQSTVYYAKLNADGTVGSWSTTTAMAATRLEHASVAVNGYLYNIAGRVSGSVTGQTAYAKLNTDGTVGSWSTTSALGDVVNHSSAVAMNGYLYNMGGNYNTSTDYRDVYYAQLNSDGTVGTWTQTTDMNVARRKAASVAVNGYILTIGGEHGTVEDTQEYVSSTRATIGGSLDLVGLSGENLAEGGSGGHLTAGNTHIAGTLQVTDAASFLNSATIEGNLRVGSAVNFKNAVDSTEAFQIQTSNGAALLTANTSGYAVYVGNDALTTGPALLYLSDRSNNAAGNAQITGNWQSSNNWGIGANSNTNDSVLRFGRTTSDGVHTWATNANLNAHFAGTLKVQPTTGNDSTTAFMIQNAAGSSLLGVGSIDTNLVINPGAEIAFGSEWDFYGSNTTATRYTTTKWNGDASVKVTVGSSTANAGAQNNLGAPLSTTTAYTLSFYAKLKTGDPAFTDISAIYRRDGSTTDATCASFNTQNVVSSGWTRITCTFTTSGSAGNASADIAIFQSAAAAREFYIDGVQLEATSNIAHAYGAGTIKLDAPLNSALLLQNSEDSTTAFQIQNAAGTSLFVVDSTNSTITVGSGGNTASFASTGELTLAGTGRHTRKITLSAEYGGAALSADGGSNTGIMTTDNMTSSPFRNYYKWTTTQGTAQDYDVWVKIPLPSDWSAWPTSQTICVDTYASATTANGVAVTLYDTANASVTLSDGDLTPSGTNTWQNQCTSSITTGTYAADGTMTLDIKLTAPATTGEIRIGDITLNYLSKW